MTHISFKTSRLNIRLKTVQKIMRAFLILPLVALAICMSVRVSANGANGNIIGTIGTKVTKHSLPVWRILFVFVLDRVASKDSIS